MSNLLTRDNANGSGLFARPFADIWSFDPFRAISSVEINRTETGYTVEVPVAGFRPNEIEISLEDGLLTVNGKSERRSFTRSFSLPEETDQERIEAHVEHGMLTLALPLLPKAQPKKIQIKAN